MNQFGWQKKNQTAEVRNNCLNILQIQQYRARQGIDYFSAYLTKILTQEAYLAHILTKLEGLNPRRGDLLTRAEHETTPPVDTHPLYIFLRYLPTLTKLTIYVYHFP